MAKRRSTAPLGVLLILVGVSLPFGCKPETADEKPPPKKTLVVRPALLPSPETIYRELQEAGWHESAREDEGGYVIVTYGIQEKNRFRNLGRATLEMCSIDNMTIRLQLRGTTESLEKVLAKLMPKLWPQVSRLPSTMSDYMDALGRLGHGIETANGIAACILREDALEELPLRALILERCDWLHIAIGALNQRDVIETWRYGQQTVTMPGRGEIGR